MVIRACRIDDLVPPISWDIAEDLQWVIDLSARPTLVARYHRLILDALERGIVTVKQSVIRALRLMIGPQGTIANRNLEDISYTAPLVARLEDMTPIEASEASKERFLAALRQTFSNAFVEKKVRDLIRATRQPE